MKILIVGGGGREHALAWKCADKHTEVLVAPGNAGTALEKRIRNVDVSADDIHGLMALATQEQVDLTIVGPETPLVEGIVDHFTEQGHMCFGPTAKAAQLEGSKIFAKQFLERHNIPTAAYKSFTDLELALTYVIEQGAPIVIKADGLRAGKGVVVARTLLEAKDAVVNLLQKNDCIVIEEFLEGEEVSFIVITDGKTVLPLATSQDHKARDDGDVGPNTGGMGAYSPASVITTELETRIMNEIINPTLDGLRADGIDYRGFLYAGLMITKGSIPKVLEFNCRLGDPETQPIMMRLKSNLVELCMAAMNRKLDTQTIEWDPRAALGVVIAAGGYPNKYKTGDRIIGLSKDTTEQKVFHAGTTTIDNHIVTNGGRVLCVVGLGETICIARDVAYAQVEQIKWNNQLYRHDIGHRAILLDK